MCTAFKKWDQLIAVLFFITNLTAAHAQDYPIRAIRLVNPYAPGGSTDPVIRPITLKLQEAWGQAIFIDNKPGAGTNLGSELVAKSKPDGYTLLLGTSSLAISPSLYKNLNYDPAKDLVPIAMLVNAPFTFAISSKLPFKTLKELIEHARQNPNQLTYGSSGNGGAIHLAMELFQSITKIKLLHIPYKGSGQALSGLISGDINVMLSPEINFTQHVKTGKIRTLAVASPKRIEGLQLPTVSESGMVGFEAGVWMALFAPAETPKAIIQKINQEVGKVLKDKTMIDNFSKMGMEIGSGSPEDLARFYLKDMQRWPQVVQDSGAKID
ncbi:MAG: Bug family tripartite tricarboxylate transporter substrate binding protein [Burkholderiaceae bacterium]